MLELAAHILDIAENSVRAGSRLIEINIDEDTTNDSLSIEIIDNGHGMKHEEIEKVLDPFYTTKTVRRIGLGLPLLADAAQRSGGHLNLESQEGKGTTVKIDTSNICLYERIIDVYENNDLRVEGDKIFINNGFNEFISLNRSSE